MGNQYYGASDFKAIHGFLRTTPIFLGIVVGGNTGGGN